MLLYVQGDQKVSVHLMITVQSSGALRLFDYPVCAHTHTHTHTHIHTVCFLYNFCKFHMLTSDVQRCGSSVKWTVMR
jgi:hypothetical protein